METSLAVLKHSAIDARLQLGTEASVKQEEFGTQLVGRQTLTRLKITIGIYLQSLNGSSELDLSKVNIDATQTGNLIKFVHII
jgi:hypothetical protein